MKRHPARQLCLALSMMAAMALGAAIFVWGSEYKCSLYHVHPERHSRIVVAKLLSEKKRPVVSEATALAGASQVPVSYVGLGAFLTAFFREGSPGSDWRLTAVLNHAASGRRRSFVRYSFRAPPVIAA